MVQTHMIAATQLHKGHQIVSRLSTQPLRVIQTSTCADGSIRVITTLDEQRMSPAFMVRVLH